MTPLFSLAGALNGKKCPEWMEKVSDEQYNQVSRIFFIAGRSENHEA